MKPVVPGERLKGKEADMKRFQKILMATDLSEASAPAWRRAVEMASDNRAELLVAHAYLPPYIVEMGAMSPQMYDEWDEKLRSDIAKRLQLLVQDASKSGVTARPLVLVGNPEETIVDAASENGVDLVVMGTHGRRGMSRFFLGSVAARVIATAPCAVMTVRVEYEALSPGLPQEKAMTSRVRD
jgi:nucleotide-binding universal stress UspA family protein